MSNATSGRTVPHGERSASESDAKKDRESVGQAPANTDSRPFKAFREIGRDAGGHASVEIGRDATERGEPRMAARSAAAPAALPCLNRNNSTGAYRFEERPDSVNCFQSSDGRSWAGLAEGRFWNMDELSSPERKAAFQLRGNIDSFVSTWGQGHCGFWTLTDLEGVTPRQFARRWNSFLAHHGEWLRAFVRVLEPQMNGNPHYHVLAAVGWDMRPADFDWEAFGAAARRKGETKFDFRARQRTAEWREMRRRYVASSAPETVALWRRMRKHLEAYHLGRSEFVPVRKVGAITAYVGKYLEAGIRIRINGWKGARRVETDRRTSGLWKTHSRVFSWASPGAREWRERVSVLGDLLGVNNLDGITQSLGSHWAYWMRGYMTAPVDEWRELAPRLVDLLHRHKLTSLRVQ